jgi:hypothetical protein
VRAAESQIYARYILKNVSDPKVAVLCQNDDSDKDYFTGLRLGGKADKTSVGVHPAWRMPAADGSPAMNHFTRTDCTRPLSSEMSSVLRLRLTRFTRSRRLRSRVWLQKMCSVRHPIARWNAMECNTLNSIAPGGAAHSRSQLWPVQGLTRPALSVAVCLSLINCSRDTHRRHDRALPSRRASDRSRQLVPVDRWPRAPPPCGLRSPS